uniref:Uncharacterized protein n=1 Tax=Romanomermis culicivorax TaxID=13658 RepID=A0A915HQQ2_ROMCU
MISSCYSFVSYGALLRNTIIYLYFADVKNTIVEMKIAVLYPVRINQKIPIDFTKCDKRRHVFLHTVTLINKNLLASETDYHSKNRAQRSVASLCKPPHSCKLVKITTATELLSTSALAGLINKKELAPMAPPE